MIRVAGSAKPRTGRTIMVEQSEFVGRVLRLLAPLGEAHDALAAARR